MADTTTAPIQVVAQGISPATLALYGLAIVAGGMAAYLIWGAVGDKKDEAKDKPKEEVTAKPATQPLASPPASLAQPQTQSTPSKKPVVAVPETPFSMVPPAPWSMFPIKPETAPVLTPDQEFLKAAAAAKVIADLNASKQAVARMVPATYDPVIKPRGSEKLM